IACANLFPIKSIYWWGGKIAKENETVIIVKTNNKNFKKLESEVKKIHSYSVPCILKIDVEANEEYIGWLKEVINNG
ncbi:MAG: divalent-cation tolerance protein CutA, partial [Nanoarchaeota archaeon]